MLRSFVEAFSKGFPFKASGKITGLSILSHGYRISIVHKDAGSVCNICLAWPKSLAVAYRALPNKTFHLSLGYKAFSTLGAVRNLVPLICLVSHSNELTLAKFSS